MTSIRNVNLHKWGLVVFMLTLFLFFRLLDKVKLNLLWQVLRVRLNGDGELVALLQIKEFTPFVVE